MAIWVGVLLALAVGFLGRSSGMDRDRAFYAVVTIVVAHYYALFAVMGASTHTLIVESMVGAAFLAAAVAGFKSSLWILVAALAAHGIFDLGHGNVIANPGVPAFWPRFCSTFDVAAAGVLAWLLRSGRVRAAA